MHSYEWRTLSSLSAKGRRKTQSNPKTNKAKTKAKKNPKPPPPATRKSSGKAFKVWVDQNAQPAGNEGLGSPGLADTTSLSCLIFHFLACDISWHMSSDSFVGVWQHLLRVASLPSWWYTVLTPQGFPSFPALKAFSVAVYMKINGWGIWEVWLKCTTGSVQVCFGRSKSCLVNKNKLFETFLTK